jgi:hypothetical protein
MIDTSAPERGAIDQPEAPNRATADALATPASVSRG